MTIERFVFALGLLAFCALLQAQTLKPGLWETTLLMRAHGELAERQASSTAAMQKQIAAMPVDQRKAFEKMMVNRNDPLGFNTSVLGKICLAKGTVELGALTLDGPCPDTISPRRGNSIKFSYSCANPPNHGEGTLVIHSPETYTLTVDATATIKRQEAHVTSETKGKWLSSDCGGVRPVLPIR